MCEIRVDYRERLLLSHLVGQQTPPETFSFVSAPLEVGDILGPRFVIERKTRGDFLASLKDGRLKTQRDRMRELSDMCRVVLVERESVSGLHEHDDACMISLFAKDCANNRGMSSLSVCCMQSTCRFILKLAQLLVCADGDGPASVPVDALMYLTPRAHCRTLLKRMGAQGDGHGDGDGDGGGRGLLGFLLALEGVGRAKALAVTQNYGSIQNLVKQLQSTDYDQAVVCMAAVCVTDGGIAANGKKKRRLLCGVATAKTIVVGLGLHRAQRPQQFAITDINIHPQSEGQDTDN
jgi:hypothetical protein